MIIQRPNLEPNKRATNVKTPKSSLELIEKITTTNKQSFEPPEPGPNIHTVTMHSGELDPSQLFLQAELFNINTENSHLGPLSPHDSTQSSNTQQAENAITSSATKSMPTENKRLKGNSKVLHMSSAIPSAALWWGLLSHNYVSN